MSQQPQNQPEEVVEPLEDESLEEVSGGICSLSNCSNSPNSN